MKFLWKYLSHSGSVSLDTAEHDVKSDDVDNLVPTLL